MPRIAIYVPKALHIKMRGRKGLNWSRIACVAFEKSLGIKSDRLRLDLLEEQVAQISKKIQLKS